MYQAIIYIFLDLKNPYNLSTGNVWLNSLLMKNVNSLA